MGVYLTVSAVCVSLGLFSIADSKRRRVLCGLIVIIMVLFAGLRYQCWTDWDSYFDYFQSPQGSYQDFEIGYVLWNRLFRLFTSTYNLYLLATYGAVFLLKFQAARKLTGRYMGLCCIVYLAQLLSSGGFRQFIALGIITFGTQFLIEGRHREYYLSCLLACLFHRTAFVCFLFPAVKLINRKIKLRHIAVLFSAGMLFYKFHVFYYLLNACMGFFRLIPSVYYRIGFYMDTLMGTSSLFSAGLLKRMVLVMGMVYVTRFSVKYRTDQGFQKMFDICFKIYLAGFFLSLFVTGQFSRINVYFYSQEAFAECLIVSGLNKRDYKAAAVMGMMVMNIAIMLYNLRFNYPELFLPYRFCLP